MPFITVLQNTENACVRAGGEFKGLILASTAWYEISAEGFHFAICTFCNFQNRSRNIYLQYPTEKSVNLGAHNCVTPACKGPSLINHRFSRFCRLAVYERVKETN